MLNFPFITLNEAKHSLSKPTEFNQRTLSEGQGQNWWHGLSAHWLR